MTNMLLDSDMDTGPPINNVQLSTMFNPNDGQINNNIINNGSNNMNQMNTSKPIEQVNSDLPDSIESIIIKQ